MPNGQVNPGQEAGVRLGDVLEQVREISLFSSTVTTLKALNLTVISISVKRWMVCALDPFKKPLNG